jgi:hypothetical protein
VHCSAITPEPPDRTAALDTHIINSNQTAIATAEIFQVRFFASSPPPLKIHR